LRVINTPVRGIGKTTVETLERVALETGTSLWGAIAETNRRQLLPQRALAALKSFRDLIEDGRAMLAGAYAERLAATSKNENEEVEEAPAALDLEDQQDEQICFDPSAFETASFDFGANLVPTENDATAAPEAEGDGMSTPEGFRAPGSAANTAELLKFLIDRTGYIKQLEAEDTPEAYSRIENLRELVNAAMDSKDRGETLDQFLDHAALVSDADAYDERAQITLMTLHAAKGLEFPLVFLCGMEEGLFPHSRTFLEPDSIEEERRLCYVGMTRAMDTLVLSRAVYRRRYGTDMPEASVPSRFLEEVPGELLEDLGTPRRSRGATQSRVATGAARPAGRTPASTYSESTHYSYEDEDQSASWRSGAERQKAAAKSYSGKSYNSIDNIAEFFASRGKKFNRPKMSIDEPAG
jgi:DNA helicase-2/ATP-dependent DNA helicase PcrA